MTRKKQQHKKLMVFAIAAALICFIPAAGMAGNLQEEQSDMQKMEREAESEMQQMERETESEMQQMKREGKEEMAEGKQEMEEMGYEAGEADRRIRQAAETLKNMMDRTGEKVPTDIIKQAKAIAVFPEVTKAGAVIGGRYGSGVLMIKQQNEWNGPLFLSIYGASIGAQIGVEQTDLVMVFNNEDALRELQDGTLEFGAEASVAAGPWGEKGKASTTADVLAYKQTEGAFAGVSLSSGYIAVADELNKQYYEKGAAQEGEARGYYPTVKELMQGKKAPDTQKADELTKALDEFTAEKTKDQEQQKKQPSKY